MIIETTLLKPAAVKIAGSLSATFLSKKVSTLQNNKTQQAQIQLCIKELCEQWLLSVMKSLAAMDYEEPALRNFFQHYTHDLERYVEDEQVAEELLKPLSDTGSHYQLNSELLQKRWQELDLQTLPEDFDIQEICNLYIKRVQKQSIVSPDLRSLYLAQLSQDSANYLQVIRGNFPDLDLDKYRELMKSRYTTLDLSALTPPVRDDMETRKILLQDVFIPQTVKENRPPRELPKEYSRIQDAVKDISAYQQASESKRIQENWIQQTTKPVLSILDNRKLIVLGDPGSGKSSLARFLLLCCLNPPRVEIEASTWLEPLKGHLPLLIELRSYIEAVSDGHCNNFLDYFLYLGQSEGYGLNNTDLKIQLQNKPALVLFDGLDEIFDASKRTKICKEIIGFASDYIKTRVLVTSRIVGYEGKLLRDADFNEYTLQDLDSRQIEIFAQGWFKLIFYDKPQEVISRIQRIQQAVEHSPAIAQLAGNPLLLTIIAIIAKHQELPRDRVLLYDHAVKVLCHHWDLTEHKINNETNNFMRDTDKLDLLRRIASRMQQTPNGLVSNTIQIDELEYEIINYLKQRLQLSSFDATSIGRKMIEQLHKRNFILCFYGGSSYGFVHRTFLEYFCADDIKIRYEKRRSLQDGIDDEKLQKLFLTRLQDDTWHEILCLICGMVDAQIAERLIGAILPKRGEAFQNSNVLTLAIQCFAEIADLSKIPKVSKQLLQCLCDWFEVTESIIYVDTKRAEDTEKDIIEKKVLIKRDPLIEELFEKNALPAVERIGKNWIGRQDFVSWIKLTNKQAAHFSGVSCFGRMVAALWSDYGEIQQDLITLTQEPGSIKYMAFDALASCFKAPTKALLEKQLIKGKDDGCIWILAAHYQNDVKIYTTISEYLQTVTDNKRISVLSALAENYRTRAETYVLIKQCLQSKYNSIRRVAVIVLADHYQNQTETYILIKKSLQDKDGYVRLASIAILKKYYLNQKKTISLITQSLQDEHRAVRVSVIGALVIHSDYNKIKKQLLSFDLDGSYPWLDPLEPITQDRVEQAAKELNLSPEAIRQHYQEIAVEIPLQLEWLAQEITSTQ